MQAQSNRPINTFTIGFDEHDFNEAQYAGDIARYLGTNHTELYVSPAETREVIPRLPMLYDEPFSDSSQIPTFIVSQLARQKVTVALSGDGGDELFGGYTRYARIGGYWRKMEWLSFGGRKVMARFAGNPLVHAPGRILGRNFLGRIGRNRKTKYREKLEELIVGFALPTQECFYHRRISKWKDPSAVVVGATEPPTVLTDPDLWIDLDEFTQRMMYLDLLSYLPDDILVKVDRASMGVSLEVRNPLLDHRVVEFAWHLPFDMKVREGKAKWILRQLLFRYLPGNLVERPKQGFGVPIDDWLRGPLRDWAETLLDARRLREEGFFHPQPIRNKWEEHLSERRDWGSQIWDVLMFQSWYQSL